MNTITQDGPVGSAEIGAVATPADRWQRIPAEMRALPQWVLAGADKAPRKPNGGYADSTDATTWSSFETVCQAATARGWDIGFVPTASDPYTCIDLDVKTAASHPDKPDKWTTSEQLERHQSIIKDMASYTELSRSGLGWHIWVRGNIGAGRNRDGVEVYSQEHFLICTGNVILDRPIVERQSLLDNMVRQMAPPVPAIVLDGPNRADEALAERMAADQGLAGRLWRGDWVAQFSSQSDADLALIKLLLPHSSSPRECWATFRLSALGKRSKAGRPDYMRRTLACAAHHLANDANDLAVGREAAEALIREMLGSAGAGDPVAAAPLQGGSRRLVGRQLGQVVPRAIDWLWTGWIPKGYITILAGESGAGKSTVLADVAARVSAGLPWPGEPGDVRRAPGRVLWLGSEDGIEEMTVPRLMACGAKLDNVIELQGVAHQGKRSTFSMQDDIEEVGKWLVWARDNGPPVAMLVIDPVTSYLPGQRLRKVDLNDAGQLRSILEPWLPFAQEHGIAIVCVTHFAKDTTKSMLHRVMGSAAFAQTCRSLCAVIEREATNDYEPEPHEKALIQVKVNLPEHPGGAYKLVTEKVEVAIDLRNGKSITATRPSWQEVDGALTANTLVGPARGPKSQNAVPFGLWLSAQFAALPVEDWVPSEYVKSAAIRDAGVSESWWNKHSSEYLVKQNQNGVWVCRPITTHNRQ